METLIIRLTPEQKRDFEAKVGEGNVSPVIRTLVSNFIDKKKEEDALSFNPSPYDYYKCFYEDEKTKEICAKLSGFERDNKHPHCLFCGNFRPQTFKLFARAGCEEEIPEETHGPKGQ